MRFRPAYLRRSQLVIILLLLSLCGYSVSAVRQSETVPAASANHPPVANAGSDQTVPTLSTVTLNGSRSTDADGDPLSYRWSLVSRPQGSAAALKNPTDVNPTFDMDVAGDYVFKLIVND